MVKILFRWTGYTVDPLFKVDVYPSHKIETGTPNTLNSNIFVKSKKYRIKISWAVSLNPPPPTPLWFTPPCTPKPYTLTPPCTPKPYMYSDPAWKSWEIFCVTLFLQEHRPWKNGIGSNYRFVLRFKNRFSNFFFYYKKYL